MVRIWCAYFPLDYHRSSEDKIFEIVKNWIKDSNKEHISEKEIEYIFEDVYTSLPPYHAEYNLPLEEDKYIKINIGKISQYSEEKEYPLIEKIGVIYKIKDKEQLWKVELGFKIDHLKEIADALITLDVECTTFGSKRIHAKKPKIISEIIDRVGGKDGAYLNVSTTPYIVDDFDKAEKILYEIEYDASRKRKLPVVYVSMNQKGKRLVDVNKLSYVLGGIAHVVTEDNYVYTLFIRNKNRERSLTRGSIGIYYQNGWVERIVELNEKTESLGYKKGFFLDKIIKEKYGSVENFLISRLLEAIIGVMKPYDVVASNIITEVKLRLVGDSKSDERVRLLEEENKYYLDEITRLEEENKILKQENEDLNKKLSLLESILDTYKRKFGSLDRTKGINIRYVNIVIPDDIKEIYPGEITHMVFNALKYRLSHIQKDRREYEIIENILEHFSNRKRMDLLEKEQKEIIELIKGIFKEKSIKKRIKGLERLGFEVEKGGKHYKIRYPSSKAMEIIDTTPGEGRENKNAPQQIIKKFLSKV